MARRLRKDESPMDRVEKIEGQLKAWRTKLARAATSITKLEKQRSYYVQRAVEKGIKS